MNDEGLENIRIAILQQAVDDYITALIYDEGANASSLERFFRSAWGELLSNYHGDYIICECKRRARRKG